MFDLKTRSRLNNIRCSGRNDWPRETQVDGSSAGLEKKAANKGSAGGEGERTPLDETTVDL